MGLYFHTHTQDVGDNVVAGFDLLASWTSSAFLDSSTGAHVEFQQVLLGKLAV